MKVEVNKDVCIGCGVCQSLCSECFSLNESEGKAEVVKDDGCSSCDVSSIAGECPVGAISVAE